VTSEACLAPIRRIMKNAQVDGELLIERVRHSGPNFGVNMRQIQDPRVVNLIEQGIIDPLAVVKNAFQYGSSIASILMSSECALLNE
jgi:chaperonin GroEL